MELKEFAEIILFGKDIWCDKLLEPNFLTDTIEYSAILTPKSPGRSLDLNFKDYPINKKIPFPNQQQLNDAKQRGYVLHFFANHELLAMEIMALVLLKFPNAPKNFRLGIANTILEEQKHMKLYIQRMNELNVTFGEIPVNNFFWNCLSNMTSPMDFVVKMSMTFEQANLDYALFYKNLMEKVSDIKTAEILNTVYEEEIGHVKHGVTWFNRWRENKESDWLEYQKNLEFPLTPARAKGLIFDIYGREKAGLSSLFIKELSIFNSSKGRPPNVFFFNPASEQEIARKKIGFTANKSVTALENDCASLLQFLAANDDIVLLKNKPSIHFLQNIQKCGFPIPEFQELSSLPKENINHQYISNFNPWGWSPESISFFSKWQSKLIKKNFFHENIFSNAEFQKNVMLLYSKSFSANLYPYIYKELISIQEILPESNLNPRICNSKNECLEAINYFLQSCNFSKVVMKAPLGCAGQNMLRVEKTKLTIAEENWLLNILETQNSIVIEPWYHKVVDLSYQAKINEDGNYIALGSTRFITDLRGQYKGTIVGKKTDDLPKNVTKFLYKKYADFSNIEDVLKFVSEKVGEKLVKHNFYGPFGIDAFLYEDINSEYGFKLKFLSEINPRYTMGRVALEISKRIQTGAFAVWVHLRVTDILKKSQFKSLAEFVTEIEKRYPIKLTEEAKPLIREGIVFTNDPSIATSVLTVLIVGKNVLNDFTTFSSLEII
ncbi:DUF455 family protein [Pigmentibacter sp. JX0631]|uniref:DUF455 family protein n=1 Tax=Pigmentibacter sp. JX0631 TaxID=2976982 RepID=UPI0024696D34|nr:DUF455 family protein [Pigmentibacter sp. JX0631]WGL58678.1 DUF455 family protein [Pigmentibacter sp. JX0631]